MKPKFSICIPNYNYGNYIGETIQSVLNQTYQDFEICIADNASNDNSWDVIQEYSKNDDRIKTIRNKRNVGFAGNLDIVSSLAEGDWHIMLSSDDLIHPDALNIYNSILEKNGNDHLLLLNSGFKQFDNLKPENNFYVGYNKYIWQGSKTLDTIEHKNVIQNTAASVLKHGIEKFVSPFNFVALCYSKELYKDVDGYGSTRLMNPDRWFHWKLCTKADRAIFVDLPLFSYRWHSNNQTAIQEQSGVLKFWIDEYRNCFELNNDHIKKSGLTKQQIEKSFFRKVIIGYGYANLAYGNPLKSLRITAFGIFSYPFIFFKNLKALILLFSMILYPITWMMSKIVSKTIYGK